MRKGPSPEIIHRIEAMEGRSVHDAVAVRYVNELFTYRRLCGLWRINVRTLMRLMKHCGVTPRKGGDAVAVQWVNNDARRKKTAETMRATARNIADSGRHWHKGRTKATCKITEHIAQRLKETTSARRPDVRTKMGKTAAWRYAQNPANHPNSGMSLTRAKAAVKEFLESKGLRVVFNYRIGRYWINLFLPDRRVGIECRDNRRFPLSWIRHREITGYGVRLLYVLNGYAVSGNLGNLYEHIAALQPIGSSPAGDCQHTVIWCHSGFPRICFDDYHITCKLTAMDGGYRIETAASSDNEVS